MLETAKQIQSDSGVTSIRQHCVGMPRLDARLADWMKTCLDPDNQRDLKASIAKYGSPLNLIATEPFTKNIGNFKSVAAASGIDFEVYFARKANKCLSFVDAAQKAPCGVDVASLQELEQVLARDFDSDKIICTAAVKSEVLLRVCVVNRIVVAVDNLDELQRISVAAESIGKPARIALRVSGFEFEGDKLFSRFGFDIDDVLEVVQSLGRRTNSSKHPLNLVGLHFHLDGYCHKQRISAISQCIPMIDQIRKMGHGINFLDMGGGIPMSYLLNQSDWETFWNEHRKALLGERTPITYRNHGLGLVVGGGEICGQRKSYPYYQSPVTDSGVEADQCGKRQGIGSESRRFAVQSAWLRSVLDAGIESSTPSLPGKSAQGSTSIADAIRSRDLQLRCEPGRSLLDCCGMTIAKVEFRKRHRDGHWLIGLAMNHTQCRTSSDDFLVDPMLLKTGKLTDENEGLETADHREISGYLVGAYCTESELLCKRLLRFPNGVSNGDLIVFPNTAGYLMHFLESRSHQFPLAKNVTVTSGEGGFEIDPIENVD